MHAFADEQLVGKLDRLREQYRTVDVDATRFNWFVQLLREVEALPAGDYIEVGVLWGLTLRIISQLMQSECQLYGFDTFDGFDARDLVEEKIRRPFAVWNPGSSHTPNEDRCFFPTSVERVREFCGDPPNLTLVQGWVPESLMPYLDRQWRFIHLDVDLYLPTKRCLELLWPNLVSGGVVIVHDYAMQSFAASEAVDEFCNALGLKFTVLNDYMHSALIRKA